MRLSAGLGLLGLGSYAMLFVVGKTATAAGLAAFSAFWAACFGLVIGIFFPLEQLVSRAVAAAGGVMPFRVRRVVAVYRVAAVAGSAFLVAGSGPIADAYAGGRRLLPIALAAFLLVYAIQSVQRGWYAGSGILGRYAAQLAIEGGFRLAIAFALLALVESGGERFAAIALVVGAAVAMVATGRIPKAPIDGTDAPGWRVVAAEAAALSASASVALIVMNAGPAIVVRLGGTDVRSAAFAAVFIVARVPLFFSGVLQALAVPYFAPSWAAGDRAGYRSRVLRVCAPVALGSLVIVPVFGVLADFWSRTLFQPEYQIGRVRGVALATSTAVFLLASVMQSALVAAERVSWVGGSWLGAVTAFAVALVLTPGEPASRVAVAYVVCAIVVVCCQLALLTRLLRAPRPNS